MNKLRLAGILGLFVVRALIASELPVIPVGLEAFRQWDHWAYQRIGARAYMRSTYDFNGGNEGMNARHFLDQLADDYNVTLDVRCTNMAYFASYNHWHTSPWHYNLDRIDNIVQETRTSTPDNPVADSVSLPTAPFCGASGRSVQRERSQG